MSFMLLFRDLIRLFACYNDGIINLLEKYFDMNKKQARDALDLYKKFLVRMDRVGEFLKVAEVCHLIIYLWDKFVLNGKCKLYFRTSALIRVIFPIWQKRPVPCWMPWSNIWLRWRDVRCRLPIRPHNRRGLLLFLFLFNDIFLNLNYFTLFYYIIIPLQRILNLVIKC